MINNTIQTGVNINITKQRLDFKFLVIWNLRKDREIPKLPKVHNTELTINIIERILWKKIQHWRA